MSVFLDCFWEVCDIAAFLFFSFPLSLVLFSKQVFTIGGLSFMSTQYGWASTHISEYEIVLANGTVTTATKDKNADLHRALQASGGIMGVVTRFTLNTFPLGQIWGGQRFYSAAQTPKMLAAIRDFTEHYPDPRAAIIATSETTLYGALGLWVVFFFYNGPVVPQNVFANFSKISHISSNTKTQSFSSFVYDNNKFSLNGSYYAVSTS
jgi:FAD/FMN-containing dehydrogenase